MLSQIRRLFEMWRRRCSPRHRIAQLAAGLLLLMAPVAVYAEPQVVASDRVTRNVVVRAGPNTASDAVDALDPGEQLPLIGEIPRWFRVRLPDGTDGYVSKSWTVVIDGVPETLTTAGVTKLHMIDVGTGLALFFEGPGWTMIYDGGSQDDASKGENNRLLAYLRAVRPDLRVIDHLFLSHPHEDHQELLPDLFDSYDVRHVWDSGRVQQTAGYCRFLRKAAAEAGATYHAAVPDGVPHRVRFQAGSCTGQVTLNSTRAITPAPVRLNSHSRFVVLHADSSPHADPNGNSVVVRVDVGSRRLLLTGDAEGGERKNLGSPARPNSIEGRLLRDARGELRADVLVVGHHGSLTSSRLPFLDAVGASVFLISSGPHAYSGVVLPDADVRNELDRRGDVYLTTINDAQCRTAAQKIGRDRDSKPGGCTNVIVTVGPGNALATQYSTRGD